MLWAAIPTAIAGIVITFFVLPLVLTVRVGRTGEDESLDLVAGIGAWLGLLGLIARRQASAAAWEIGPRLCGYSLGIWYTLGGHKAVGMDPTDEPIPATTEQTEPAIPPPLWQRVSQKWSTFRPLVQPAWRLVRSVPGVISIRKIRARGRVGLADPATTGQMQGLLHALQGALPNRVELDVASDFVQQGARGELAVRIHFRLGLLLAFASRFAVTAAWRWALQRFSLWRSTRAGAAA